MRAPAGPAVAERVFERDVTLHAPHLIDLEVANAEALDATLLTRDASLSRIPGTHARVDVV